MTVVLRHNFVGAEVAPAVRLDRRGRRLSAVVKRHAPKDRPFIVSLHRRDQSFRPADDTVRLRKTWAQTLVGANDTVVITQLPLGPSGGGANSGLAIGAMIGLAALAIALPFALPIIAPAIFTAGSFLTAAASAGIVLGAGYVFGKVVQANANPTDTSGRPLYGVSGGGNLPRPGDRIPWGWGTFWTQPDLTQPDFSIYDGDDMLLYKRHTLGLGQYQIHKIMLGAATLWTEADGVVGPFDDPLGGASPGQIGQGINGGTSGSLFGGTQVEFIAPGGTSDLVPASVYSSPSVGGSELPHTNDNPNHAGPFRASPVGKQTSRIQIDFGAPQGSSHGDAPTPWEVLFEYAPCDDDDQPTGAWTTLVDFGANVHTTNAYRFTRIVDVTLGDYIVRGTNVPLRLDGYVNAATWDGLRSHYPETITRPHVTEIALKIRSGKSLGITAFGDIWVQASRIAPTWNGSAWVDAQTSKSVYAFKDILQADYGGQLADNQVDLERVKFYAGELSEFDTFDGVIRGPVSVWEAAATVLGTMRAEPARIANTWSINRDEPRAVKKHVISRRQIARGTTAASFKIARDDGAADVIVEYAPASDPRRRRDIRVTFGAQSLTPNRSQLVGISSHEHAYHIATWKAAAAYFRRERRKLTLDRRGRLIQRGDPALIDTWFMTDARAGGVMLRGGTGGRTLTLDTPMVVGDATYATLRDQKNREWGPVKVTAGSSANIIILDAGDVAAIEADLGVTLDQALSGDTQEMTTVLVGPLAELQDGYLIEGVAPQSRDRVTIDALFDHQGVWDALGEDIPSAPPIPSVGDITDPATTVLPWVSARCVQKGVALVMEWAVGPARGAIANVVKLSYNADDDVASWEPVSNDLSTSGSYPLRHAEGINVRVGAWALNKFGVPGPAVYATFTTFKPAVNSDSSDLLVEVRSLSTDLDARVRQIVDQLPALFDSIQSVADDLSASLASQVATLKEAHGRTLISLGERYQQNVAQIDQVAIAYATADEALAALITTLTATVGGNTASISAELIARADGDSALAGEITSLSATVGANMSANTAAITDEAVARADGDSAEASHRTDLAVAIYQNGIDYRQDDPPSSPTVGQTWIDTNNSNLLFRWNGSAWINIPYYSLAKSAATLVDEQVVRADADTAIAGSVTTLSGHVADNAAAITDEAGLRVSGDSALAARITTLLATGPGGTAEGKFRIVTASTPSGAVASISLEVNVSTTLTPSWQPTGLYLDAMSGFGRIRLVANLIELDHPSINGGTPEALFSVASVDGANRAVFNTDVYMQRLVADAIQAKHIQSGELTKGGAGSVGSSTSGNNLPQTIATFTVNLPDTVSGHAMPVFVGGTLTAQAGSGSSDINVGIYINSVLAGSIVIRTFGAGTYGPVSITGYLQVTGTGSAMNLVVDMIQICPSGYGVLAGSSFGISCIPKV